jgi:hypothetical protein
MTEFGSKEYFEAVEDAEYKKANSPIARALLAARDRIKELESAKPALNIGASETIPKLFDEINVKDKSIAELEALVEAKDSAMKALMEAHREVFKHSLFAGFRAGKTNFQEKWQNAEKALALTPEALRQKIAARDAVIKAAKFASRILDDIKYELYARVYTVIDDEFESVFLARDSIDLALDALKESEK